MKLIPACDLSSVSPSLSLHRNLITLPAVYLLFIHARIPLMHWGRKKRTGRRRGGEQWKKVEATTIPLPR